MKYYFITGTSSGIGRAMALALLEDENNVVTGLSRRQNISHPNYHHIKMDMSVLAEVEAFQFQNLPKADKIVLINNAGQIGDIKRIGAANAQRISALYKVNVVAPALLTNAFMATYQREECEKIILNVSSGAGKYPIDAWAPYCSSKAAIDMFSLVVAEEQKIKNTGFRIYAIAPGVVDTEMQMAIRASSPSDFSRQGEFVSMKQNVALNSPENVARKYLYIMDNQDSYPEVVFSLRDIM